MSPILGIWASSQQPALNATSFDSIATATGTGSSGTITFSSIPSTYKHLQIRYFGKTSSGSDFSRIRFNSDTSSNYYSHSLYGSGSAAGASAFAGSTYTAILFGVYSNTGGPNPASTNVGTVGIIDILDYTSTNKNKTTRTLIGTDANGSGNIEFDSGSWSATPAAITQIDIIANGFNWDTTSKFALYGIKG